MRALFVSPLVVLTGCALVSGLSDLDVGSDDAGATVDASEAGAFDVSADVGRDAIDFDALACSDASCAGVASPWTPVASTTTVCPKGWVNLEFVTNPTLGSACACGCTVTAPPTCDVGTCTATAGTSPACTLGNLNLNFNGAGCLSLPQVILAPYQKLVPVPLKGGTCTATPNPNGVTTTAARLCAPPDCDASAALCSGSVPNGVSACVVAPGDSSCPIGYPVRSLVGTSAAATCNSNCTCQVNGTCASPKVSFYSDTNCTSLVITNDATGTCAADPASGMQVRGAKYAATVSSSCTPSGTASGTVSLVGPRTVCCRP